MSLLDCLVPDRVRQHPKTTLVSYLLWGRGFTSSLGSTDDLRHGGRMIEVVDLVLVAQPALHPSIWPLHP